MSGLGCVSRWAAADRGDSVAASMTACTPGEWQQIQQQQLTTALGHGSRNLPVRPHAFAGRFGGNKRGSWAQEPSISPTRAMRPLNNNAAGPIDFGQDAMQAGGMGSSPNFGGSGTPTANEIGMAHSAMSAAVQMATIGTTHPSMVPHGDVTLMQTGPSTAPVKPAEVCLQGGSGTPPAAASMPLPRGASPFATEPVPSAAPTNGTTTFTTVPVMPLYPVGGASPEFFPGSVAILQAPAQAPVQACQQQTPMQTCQPQTAMQVCQQQQAPMQACQQQQAPLQACQQQQQLGAMRVCQTPKGIMAADCAGVPSFSHPAASGQPCGAVASLAPSPTVPGTQSPAMRGFAEVRNPKCSTPSLVLPDLHRRFPFASEVLGCQTVPGSAPPGVPGFPGSGCFPTPSPQCNQALMEQAAFAAAAVPPLPGYSAGQQLQSGMGAACHQPANQVASGPPGVSRLTLQIGSPAVPGPGLALSAGLPFTAASPMMPAPVAGMTTAVPATRLELPGTAAPAMPPGFTAQPGRDSWPAAMSRGRESLPLCPDLATSEASGSFGDVSAMSSGGTTMTPGVVRPTWQPQTPRPVEAPVIRSSMPPTTEPNILDLHLTVLFGVEEDPRKWNAPPGLIPTPARAKPSGTTRSASSGVTNATGASSLVDVGIQVNRNSLAAQSSGIQGDKKAEESSAPELAASLDFSLCKSNSDVNSIPVAPVGESVSAGTESAPAPGRGRARSTSRRQSISDLTYPAVEKSHIVIPSEAPSTWRGRILLARRVTEVVSDELQRVEESWGISGSDSAKDSMLVERLVADFLRKVALTGERSFLLRILQPVRQNLEDEDFEGDSLDDEKEAELNSYHDQLESAIAVEDRRIESLKELANGFEEPFRQHAGGLFASSCRDLCQFISEVTKDLDSCRDTEAAKRGSAKATEDLQQCMQKVALLDQYLLRTQIQLEDARKQMTERERVVAAQGYAHLPGGCAHSLRNLR